MGGRGLRRLVHEHVAVSDGEQGHLLANLGAVERGGGGLTAGVGVTLGIKDHHAHRLARREQPGEVLEAAVEHRTVAAHREDRRAEGKLLVGELLPGEGA